MASRRHAEIVILGEDAGLALFLRGFLIGRGYDREKLYAPAPTGGWAGLYGQYPKAVRSYRAKASFQATRALVVGLDADELTVQERKAELDGLLRKSELLPRQGGELICLTIPKRHIETWIAFLRDQGPVDEIADFKKTLKEPAVKLAQWAGKELAKAWGPEPPAGSPPALREAWQELRERLPS